MTTTETQTSPWGDSPERAQPDRLRRYAETARTAVQIILSPGLTIAQRLDYLDYHCSPSWTWTLRNWWRRTISRRSEWRQADELKRRTLVELDERIEQAKSDERFWLIVNDPNY